MRKSFRFLALIAVIAAFLPGCQDSLFDETEVFSAREHLVDEAKGGDLLQAMDKAGVTRVLLAGAYNVTFDPQAEIDWDSAFANNELLLDAAERVPGRIVAFPLIRGDEAKLLSVAREMVKKGARGFRLTNGLPGQRRAALDAGELRPFYAWCELNHLALLVDVDYDTYGGEFESLLRDYPNLPIIGGRMLGLIGDVPRLFLLMQRFNNLYLDFSFGWDAEKKAAFDAILSQRDAFERLVEKHATRVLWGTQIIIARGVGRNVDWLTQYMLDNRFFLERSSVKLKLLLNNQPVLLKMPGLDLSDQTLAQLYSLNLKSLSDNELIHLEDADLDTLIIDTPAGATFNEKGPFKLVVACVTGMKNPVESMFSARMKNIVNGAITDWREINGVESPIRIVTVAPLDKWLPTLLRLESTVPIEVLSNAEAVRHRVLEQPGTLAFIPFSHLRPGMRVIPIDGESPDVPYIRDCARRGGALARYYFNRYPLLFPFDAPGAIPPALVLDPHKLRRVVLTDQLLPATVPPPVTTNEELDPVTDAFFKVAPLLQSFDLTVTTLTAPFQQDCAPGARCLLPEWIGALDYAGVDIAAVSPEAGAAGLDVLARHHLRAAALDGEPVVDRLRGANFAILAFDADREGWEPAALEKIRAAEAAGQQPFVYLFTSRPPTESAAAAYKLAAAKPAAIVIAGDHPPGGLEVVNDTFIFYGLGNVAFLKGAEIAFPLSMVARFTFYGDRMINVALSPVRRQGSKLAPLFAGEFTEALTAYFHPPATGR
jgi:hypothetical protein